MSLKTNIEQPYDYVACDCVCILYPTAVVHVLCRSQKIAVDVDKPRGHW